MLAAGLETEWLTRVPGLSRLWSLTKGSPEVRVAVLDGPVDATALPGAGIAPSGAIQHGTLVSSIISGSRDGSVPGLAPGCTVLPIPIFEEAEPGGEISCSQATLADAIERAGALGAHIVNISAAQQIDPMSLATPLSAALQDALARDALVVAAAGNHGCACDTIPASVAGVLAVGAHDGTGAPLLISNWGPGQRGQGLLAPGIGVPGTCVGGGLCRGTGTSFAAALVSGLAALLMSLDVRGGRRPSGTRVRQALLGSADPCPPDRVELCSTHLSGRLNLDRAVERMLGSSEAGADWEGTVTTNDAMSASPIGGHAGAGGARHGDGAAVGLAGTDPPRPAPPDAGGIGPADCGCGCGGKCNGDCGCGGKGGHGEAAKASEPRRVQLVYAIGRLGVSFPSQTRRDAIWRATRGAEAVAARTPEIDLRPVDNASLRELLDREPYQAQSVIWVLSRTEVPMYAIVPSGAFAAETYQWLVEQWTDEAVEFISLPGYVGGQVTLYDGLTVDAVVPDLRGMYSWNSRRYIDALAEEFRRQAPGAPAADGAPDDDAAPPRRDPVTERINRFLSKIYFRIRNRGLAPEERALNAAATNAFNLSDIVVEAGENGFAFRDISVERSPLSRPGSEYYDVLLTFFDPLDRQGKAPLVARFTVDVSDTVPVVVGEPVSWYEY